MTSTNWLESEVVVEIDGQAEQFDTSIVVRVASYTSREAADSVTQNLTKDFAYLSVVVKTVPRDGYFAVRISEFKDNRTLALVTDQLVKVNFAPISIKPQLSREDGTYEKYHVSRFGYNVAYS